MHIDKQPQNKLSEIYINSECREFREMLECFLRTVEYWRNISSRLMWTHMLQFYVLCFLTYVLSKPTFIVIGSRLIILLAHQINYRWVRLVFLSNEALQTRFKWKWVVHRSALAISRKARRCETACLETSISLFISFVFLSSDAHLSIFLLSGNNRPIKYW